MAAEGLPMSTPPSMAAMGLDWYQSGRGLVIDFCTNMTGKKRHRHLHAPWRGLPPDVGSTNYWPTGAT